MSKTMRAALPGQTIVVSVSPGFGVGIRNRTVANISGTSAKKKYRGSFAAITLLKTVHTKNHSSSKPRGPRDGRAISVASPSSATGSSGRPTISTSRAG